LPIFSSLVLFCFFSFFRFMFSGNLGGLLQCPWGPLLFGALIGQLFCTTLTILRMISLLVPFQRGFCCFRSSCCQLTVAVFFSPFAYLWSIWLYFFHWESAFLPPSRIFFFLPFVFFSPQDARHRSFVVPFADLFNCPFFRVFQSLVLRGLSFTFFFFFTQLSGLLLVSSALPSFFFDSADVFSFHQQGF